MDSLATPRTVDFIVIGAGIAGASVAYELAAHGRTLLLERETLPGQHTTGRSAAFLVESYGSGVVQRLTRASRPFLENPPEGFAQVPVVSPRPCMWIARSDQLESLERELKQAALAGTRLERIEPAEAERLCPVLRPGYTAAAAIEADSMSIDVAALLAGFVAGFRARGGSLVAGAAVDRLESRGSGWQVYCGEAVYCADVVVNAAGAWAEDIGRLARARAIGLTPLRRTAITFDPPAGVDIASWVCTIDADEDFYLKPEGAQLLASPCDETPSPPCDVSPDEMDVALAADRINRATTLELRTIRRSWAGLRSFVADRSPVIGMDPTRPGFFWLAGQGGFGIMTSSAAARAAASLITQGELPADQRALGLRRADLSPERLPTG